jgi:hypothetical protein
MKGPGLYFIGNQRKVLFSVAAVLAGTYLVQNVLGSKKKGHGYFDVEKYFFLSCLCSFFSFSL